MGTAGRRKKLPVGIEDFEEIRTEGFYYVDKTAMIRELLNRWGKVNLLTRPGGLPIGDRRRKGTVPGIYGKISGYLCQLKRRLGG